LALSILSHDLAFLFRALSFHLAQPARSGPAPISGVVR
jgi:hypothetical protein